MLSDEVLDRVLSAVVAHDSRRSITLTLAADDQWDAVADANGALLDEALRELKRNGYLTGDRSVGDGSVVWWSRLVSTGAGLRHLGEWPPCGSEDLPGPWDELDWGRVARPCLAWVKAELPAHGCILRDAGSELVEWRRWQTFVRLLAAGFLDGDVQDDLISDARLTKRGHEVLDPPENDPVRRARLALRQGAKADAVTAAVDEVLKPWMICMAQEVGVDARRGNAPKRLANLNDDLRGTYGKAVHAYISAWLHDRNSVDHGEGTTVPNRRLELLIDGIELLTSQNVSSSRIV